MELLSFDEALRQPFVKGESVLLDVSRQSGCFLNGPDSQPLPGLDHVFRGTSRARNGAAHLALESPENFHIDRRERRAADSAFPRHRFETEAPGTDPVRDSSEKLDGTLDEAQRVVDREAPIAHQSLDVVHYSVLVGLIRIAQLGDGGSQVEDALATPLAMTITLKSISKQRRRQGQAPIQSRIQNTVGRSRRKSAGRQRDRYPP